MLADLFSSAELVRVIDFLLDEPGRAFNKSELAEGADISRPTVYKLLPHLSSLGLVTSAVSSGGAEGYRLNTQSTLVRSLLRFDNELSKNMAQAGISTPEPYGEIAGEIAPEAASRMVAWAELLGVRAHREPREEEPTVTVFIRPVPVTARADRRPRHELATLPA